MRIGHGRHRHDVQADLPGHNGDDRRTLDIGRMKHHRRMYSQTVIRVINI